VDYPHHKGNYMSFDTALNNAMLYEVGPFWNLNTPGVREGLIGTQQQRRACGYVNLKNDRGGETKFGVAANANPDLNITTLTWEQAARVYYKRYWLVGDCQELDDNLAFVHFDACVNHGTGRAAKMIQEAVGANIDGDIGPATLKLIKAMDQRALLLKLMAIRKGFMQKIVANDPSQACFIKGWLSRVDQVFKQYS
jgi:lysozyme family protein